MTCSSVILNQNGYGSVESLSTYVAKYGGLCMLWLMYYVVNVFPWLMYYVVNMYSPMYPHIHQAKGFRHVTSAFVRQAKGFWHVRYVYVYTYNCYHFFITNT